MDNLETEKTSYGFLERLIYIVLLPVLFTLVLTGVLLTLFDYDVKNTVYKFGARIPIIKHIVPEEDNVAAPPGNPANELILSEQRIEELSAVLADKEREIEQLKLELEQKNDDVAQLENSVEKLLITQENAQASAETYRRQLKELADMYSGMSAGKAASILQNLTMPELVLVLYEMEPDNRGRLLEKMNPMIAADASIQLKDINDFNRAEYEAKAAEARAAKNKESEPGADNDLTDEELARTFAAMTPQSAAKIVMELYKTNSSKALTIVKALDANTRSRLLSAVADASTQDAAAITASLGQ